MYTAPMIEESSFDEEESQYGRIQSSRLKEPYFVRLVLATGLVKDRRQAEYAVVGLCAFALLLSIFIFFSSASELPTVKDFSQTDVMRP